MNARAGRSPAVDNRGMEISTRLGRRIERDFPEPDRATEVQELLADAVASLELDHWGAQALERIQGRRSSSEVTVTSPECSR